MLLSVIGIDSGDNFDISKINVKFEHQFHSQCLRNKGFNLGDAFLKSFSIILIRIERRHAH